MIKDDLPYEKNGRGVPVSGIKPTIADRFKMV